MGLKDKQIRNLIELKKFLQDDRGKDTWSYKDVATALNKRLSPQNPVDAKFVEKLVKDECKRRIKIGLPQIFEPRDGHPRNKPGDPPGFLPTRVRARRVLGELYGQPMNENAFLALLIDVGFQRFARFVAMTLDGLGFHIQEYAPGYKKGPDIVAVELSGDGTLKRMVVEVKHVKNGRPSVGNDIEGYMKKAKADRALIVTNGRVPAGRMKGHDLWDGSAVYRKLRKNSVGFSKDGATDLLWFGDVLRG